MKDSLGHFVSSSGRLAAVSLAVGEALTLIGHATPPRQVTHASQDHLLTNINAWSPDGRWLVYDLRRGASFNGRRIEQINVETGEVQCLYEAAGQAGCGVVTWHPREPKVVFILGPEPAGDWTYGFSRRRGVVVDARHPGKAQSLDAMNYAPPFAPGALRGGSHVHVFSPDGQWVSFTYDDEVLARLPNNGKHDANQRNVGVAVPAGPVRVNRNHPRNNDGSYFSVLVTRTSNHPKPGSDEISRACEEGWVGADGYVRADGTRQQRALAFQGTVIAPDGREYAEVFIVDLPEKMSAAPGAPLEGTESTRPAPPAGVRQRRLTFTAARRHPGIVTNPRHWLRVSPDGTQIAFLMKDHEGVVQFWTVSPNGGALRQITRNGTGISSAFTWSPDGRWIAHTMDRSVGVTEVASGIFVRLTVPVVEGIGPQPHACVFSPDGARIAYMQQVETQGAASAQLFVVALPVELRTPIAP
jgi:hypothetical protein